MEICVSSLETIVPRFKSLLFHSIVGGLLSLAALAHAVPSTITSITIAPAETAGLPATVTVNYCALTGSNQFILIAIVPQSASPTISTCPVVNQTFVVYGGYTNRNNTLVT